MSEKDWYAIGMVLGYALGFSSLLLLVALIIDGFKRHEVLEPSLLIVVATTCFITIAGVTINVLQGPRS